MSSPQTLEPEVQENAPVETCPRCHTTNDWGENSWCPDCGYYPMVDNGNPEGASWADQLPDAPVEEEDHRTALESIPGWFWLMTAGIVGIAVGSVFIRMELAEREVLRGRVALAQLTIGMFSMIVAHGIAAKFAMANDRRISIPDIFLAWFNIWQPTISKLPDTCRRLLALVWGMIASLTAVTIIGGIDYGYPFRSHEGVDLKPMNVVNAVADAARAQAASEDQPTSLQEAVQGTNASLPASGEGGDMTDAINALGEADEQLMEQMDGLENNAEELQSALEEEGTDSELSKKLNELNTDENGLRSINAAVYGVILDQRRIPTGLLFAVKLDDQWVHLTRIHQPGIPGNTFPRIIRKLNGRMTREPFADSAGIPESSQEIMHAWVKPTVLCRLTFTEVDEEASEERLESVKVEAILLNPPATLQNL